MNWQMLSETGQGIFLSWIGLLELLLFYNFMCNVQIGKGKANFRCILLCLFDYAFYVLLDYGMTFPDSNLAKIPVWLIVFFVLPLTVFAVAEQYRIIVWRKGHVSAMSIRTALDALPTGLCFFMPDGVPLLVNEKMEELVSQILGGALQNAKEAWSLLEKGDGKGVLKAGGECMYRLSDGSIYGFHREELVLEEGTVCLIRAMDITREYSMTEELGEKQKKARTMNARLKSLMNTIEYVTMSRELLNLKVALHDNLGRSLLSARRFILNPESVEPQELLNIWRRNMQHLIGEAPEEWQVPYYIARKEASTLGIDLQVVGTLPVEERLLPVIDQAISAHVINVLRHADGKTAMVYIEEKEKEYQISFTNDGKVPDKEIQMTGGLGNLKRTVEEIGGQMEVHSKPRFEMLLILPKAPAVNETLGT